MISMCNPVSVYIHVALAELIILGGLETCTSQQLLRCMVNSTVEIISLKQLLNVAQLRNAKIFAELISRAIPRVMMNETEQSDVTMFTKSLCGPQLSERNYPCKNSREVHKVSRGSVCCFRRKGRLHGCLPIHSSIYLKVYIFSFHKVALSFAPHPHTRRLFETQHLLH